MKKRLLSILLVLCLMTTLFAGITITASAGSVAAVDPTGYTKAEDVKYVKVGSYVCNWGARGEDCTFLSTYAQNYYTGNYTFEKMSGLSGSSAKENVPSSALYSALKNMMNNKSTHTTSYRETNDLYKYTDCLKSDYAHISSFYSGKQLSGTWDSGSTWNKEHTWPNSKIDNNGENDIMMLRPTWVQENSHRGNKAYGESSSYYFPNQEAGGEYDLRGDCARIVLYVYTRWGVTDKMWGSSGVMESKEILLKWMKEDPVDTWEMGRNDACQSILGVRNVFVDYPEYAFLLFNESVPTGYTSPSSQQSTTSYTVSAVSSDLSMGTVSVTGRTVTAMPKAGYYVAGYELSPAGAAKVTQSGNTFTLSGLTADCTLTVKFAAKTAVTVNFSCPAGVSCASVSGYAGDAIKLSKPTGTPTGEYDYTFKGWVESTVDNSETKPAPIYAAGDSFTPKANTTLYALYTYTIGGNGGSSTTFTKISSVDDMIDGASYVIVSSATGKAMSSNVASNWINPGSTYSGDTIEEPKATDVWTITDGVISCEAGSLTSSGAKNISLSASGTKWSFTVASGAWSIASGNNILSFNSSGWRPYSGGYGNDTAFFIYMGGAGGTTYYTTVIGEIKPCEHDYAAEVTEPTCLEAGYTTYTCSKCGDSYIADETKPLGHDYEVETIAPTETEQGYDLHICSRCGDEYMDNYTDPIGPGVCSHEWDGGRPIDPPTCTEPGSVMFTCLKCEATRYEEVEALGHDWDEGVITPTGAADICERDKDVLIFYTCLRCGAAREETIPAEGCPSKDFTDIGDATMWYHNAADFVIDAGIMGSTSTEALTFEPMTKVSRSMVASILYRIAGEGEVLEYQGTFTDVEEGAWYTTAIEWCAANGLASGKGEGIFDPNGDVTRQELAMFFYKLAEYQGKDMTELADLDTFPDGATVPDWARTALSWCVNAGIISGKGEDDGVTRLKPLDTAMRCELASILMRFMAE